ncbi:MAG: molecular chaperone HtpG, partial [Bacteroidota bacterium]|nr:molecular chaperone HtpG [Bacteroidota bacterium]
SYLQSDSNVRKISSHITKKVADRLFEIFKNDRTQFEEKWDDLKIFIEYGMLTEEKFSEKAKSFCLLKNVDNKSFTFEEYQQLIKDNQTDKDGQLIYLYASDKDAQHLYIEAAKAKGYDVLLMNGQLDIHFVGKLEQLVEKSHFVRVDSDVIDNLIMKSEKEALKLSDKEQESLKKLFNDQLPIVEKTSFTVQLEQLGETGSPVVLTQNEFMRRMQEMSAMNPGMNFYGDMPVNYNLVLNTDHPLIKGFIGIEETAESDKIKQLMDLALLSNGLLKGEALTDFVKRSYGLIN